jgi:hypothetical protein
VIGAEQLAVEQHPADQGTDLWRDPVRVRCMVAILHQWRGGQSARQLENVSSIRMLKRYRGLFE